MALSCRLHPDSSPQGRVGEEASPARCEPQADTGRSDGRCPGEEEQEDDDDANK